MMSHKSFRILGYIYASIGAFFTFVDFVNRITYNVKADSHDFIYYISPIISFILLIFFIILLVGIRLNNLTLVKVYRVSHHVSYGLVIICLTIGIVIGIGFKLLTDDDVPASFMQDVFNTLVVFIGFYLLFLWIINGVFKAIQYEKGTSETVFYQVEASDKQEI